MLVQPRKTGNPPDMKKIVDWDVKHQQYQNTHVLSCSLWEFQKKYRLTDIENFSLISQTFYESQIIIHSHKQK